MNKLNWRDPKTDPPKGPCVVILEEQMSGSFIHGAMYHPKMITISGVFHSDVPKVLWWLPESDIYFVQEDKK